ncbi:MAG: carboxypeptidase-like regulatory domain-containing protein [Bacteroidetes bacterium]|nr:carboxypeptidase-like regulatory domain-containing protein [Bacteroidota bacterium]
MVIFFYAFAVNARGTQRLTIKGVIKNDSGQAITQAPVVVKGQTGGASSNDQGQFEISANSNAVLVISSVGYQNREVAVDGRASLTVVLVNSAQKR